MNEELKIGFHQIKLSDYIKGIWREIQRLAINEFPAIAEDILADTYTDTYLHDGGSLTIYIDVDKADEGIDEGINEYILMVPARHWGWKDD
ncbi:MAG: hypothetical protein Q8P11_02960 [bacterium]|nr:hypothetical protein [bacterium]